MLHSGFWAGVFEIRFCYHEVKKANYAYGNTINESSRKKYYLKSSKLSVRPAVDLAPSTHYVTSG